MVRIMLLGLVLVLYMFFGAAVFSALERPSELKAHKIWTEKQADFAQEHSISLEDLHVLLMDYEDANYAGVWVQAQRTFWDFPGALCFVVTLIFTIGYGASAPTTIAGKIFLIFYGLIGCSAAILLFNLFLERVVTLIAYVFRKCHEEQLWCSRRQTAATSHLNTQAGGTAHRQEIRKPSLYHVTLILIAVCFLVACSASGLYSAVEGWSFLESMYFCFVTFSTIGFGDMVSGQREGYEASSFYQIANILVIFFGVCCTFSLLNLIAFMIKAMLNLVLGKVLCLNCCSETGSKKQKCVQICCSCFTRPKLEESRQLPNTASCFSQHWSCHVVKLGTGECRCAGSALQTVCKSEMHIAERKVICKHKVALDNAKENSLHMSSLPVVISGVAILNNYLHETGPSSSDTIPFRGHQTSTEQFH